LSERFQDNVLHYFANYFIVAVASLFLLGVFVFYALPPKKEKKVTTNGLFT
jgi:hypothetical protein